MIIERQVSESDDRLEIEIAGRLRKLASSDANMPKSVRRRALFLAPTRTGR